MSFLFVLGGNNMKIFKKKWLYLLLAGVIVITFPAIMVSASDKKTLLDFINASDMSNVAKNIDIMQMYHEPTGITNPIATVFYALSGLWWNIAKMIYVVIDFMLSVLFSTSSMQPLIDLVSNLSTRLYSGISGTVLITAFILGILTSAILYFVRGKSAAYKQAGSIIAVIAISAFWFTHVGTILTNVNSITDSLGANLSSSITKTLSSSQKNDTFTQMISDKSDNKTSSVEAIRAGYFQQSFYSMWLLGEYGTSNKDDNKVQTANKELLTDNVLSDDKVKEILGGNKIDDSLKKTMSKDYAIYQQTASFTSIFVVILYGIPYLFLGLINWVVTLIALTLGVILPVFAVMSMFPQYGKTFTNGIFKLLSYMLARGLILVGLVIFTLSNSIVNLIIGNNAGGLTGTLAIAGILVASILNFVLLFMLWKNKGMILSTISGGHITSIPVIDNMEQRARERFRRHEDEPEPTPQTEFSINELLALAQKAGLYDKLMQDNEHDPEPEPDDEDIPDDEDTNPDEEDVEDDPDNQGSDNDDEIDPYDPDNVDPYSDIDDNDTAGDDDDGVSEEGIEPDISDDNDGDSLHGDPIEPTGSNNDPDNPETEPVEPVTRDDDFNNEAPNNEEQE